MPDQKSEELKETSSVPAPEHSTLNAGDKKPVELKDLMKESSQAPVGEESEEDIEVIDDEDLDQDLVGDQTKDVSEVDYAAELARLRAERDNYRQGMIDAKQKNKRLNDRDSDDDDDDDTSDSHSASDMESLEELVDKKVSEQRHKWEAERSRETIDESLQELSSSPAELELIKYHYENSIKHRGYTKRSIAQDLRSAKLLANSSELIAKNEELELALQSKATLSDKPQFSGAKSTVPGGANPKVRITRQEKAFLERYGAVNRYKAQAKK